MNDGPKPKNLRERLTTATREGSKADRALASYMLAGLNELAFDTAATLAAKVGFSEPTVGRFCRSIGYRSFKDLKEHLRDDLGDKPWLVSERLRDMQARARAGEDHLARGLELEMAGLVSVYELAHGKDWARVALRLAEADRIYVAGFQTERGIAQIFANQLQYLRDDVHLLDVASGNFAEMFLSGAAAPCLVVFEARRYSRMARVLVREAQAAKIPVTLVTDNFCDWGRELADEMLVVPTQFGQFQESNALMASLANLLVNSVFLQIGPAVERRLERIQALHAGFTGYAGGPPPKDGDTPIFESGLRPADVDDRTDNKNDNKDADHDETHDTASHHRARDTGTGNMGSDS